jgi:Ca2+-binding EF-hand superfamily protein
METNLQPLETLFSSFDQEGKGGLTFDNFTALNEYVGVPMYKTELRRVFDLIDARKVGRVSMDEVRAQINLCNNNLVGTDDGSQDKIGVGSNEEGLMRQ